jgi:hypothetical protein
LGSSEFVQEIISEAEEKAKETLRLSSVISDLPSLAGKICKKERLDEKELRSGMRNRKLVEARKLFCQIAVGKMGYSGAEVARFLGVTTSAVNRLAVSDSLSKIRDYI